MEAAVLPSDMRGVAPHVVRCNGGPELAPFVAHAQRRRRTTAVTPVGIARNARPLASEGHFARTSGVANLGHVRGADTHVGDAFDAADARVAFALALRDFGEPPLAIADLGQATVADDLVVGADAFGRRIAPSRPACRKYTTACTTRRGDSPVNAASAHQKERKQQ